MNSFGKLFKITIFGESHGPYVGITIDGVPPGIKLNILDFKRDLKRRSPNYYGSTNRKEEDIPIIISGIKNNLTNGFPLTILFENKKYKNIYFNFDKDKEKNINYYEKFLTIPRPSHVDFAAIKKWGKFFDISGGGHLSGRLTVCIVAAGVVARKIINNNFTEINSNIEKRIKNDQDFEIKKNFNKSIKIKCEPIEIYGITDKKKFLDIIKKIKDENDSIGGILQCRIKGLPAGIGEPFFYSLESAISSIIFSIPSIKGIEFGAGFSFSKMKGSEANDPIVNINGKTRTNYNGGITGGISNGNDIIFNIVARPVPSIKKEQETINIKTKKIEKLVINGCHDSCHILRLPPIIEAASYIAILDLLMINKSINK
ncbi:MAG: chorismate synthase [Spirochaetes bacterium]|nr:chorismate synthase [Spirochaetota bacterium]